MKILFFVVLSFFIFANSYSSEIIDCSTETNYIKKINCKAKNLIRSSNNLKAKLNEKQAETKEKISNKAKELKAKVENN